MARISKEEKEQIRQKILQEAHQLFFEVGYDKTSTKAIAKAVGIAEGTLFNYFKTKADILFEVIQRDYYQIEDLNKEIHLSENIVEVFIQMIKNVAGKLFKLPKKMLLDLFVTTVAISKKNPNLIRKLASLDFKFLEELTLRVDQLKDQGYLKEVDSSLLAESLFSVLMYEIVLYFYETDYDLEAMYQRLEVKFTFELTPYLMTKEV